MIFPKDWDTGFSLGATANLGELADNLELFPYINYWSAGTTVFTVDISVSNFQIGGDVHYMIENVPGLYGGGGISLNFVSAETGIVSPFTGQSTTASGSSTEFGFDILGGYQLPVGDHTGFAEVKYDLVSNLNAFRISVGMLFDLN